MDSKYFGLFLLAALPSAVTAQMPGVAKGWPVQLPGAVTGTPIPADLDGDGQWEVVVPCMGRGRATAHAKPSIAALVCAFYYDGKTVEKWPLTIKSESQRRKDREDPKEAGLADNWYSSPSLCDLEKDGVHEVAIAGPGLWHSRDIKVLYGDGETTPIPGLADPWVSLPLFDLDKDGVLDVVAGETLTSLLGVPIDKWPADKMLRGGYGPCIGDANGDGEPEIYHPFYQSDWHLPEKPVNETVSGFDRHGNRLPGWPQKVTSTAIYPVMGDVVGDNKMEVIALDIGGTLHVWSWDGKDLSPTPGQSFAAGLGRGARMPPTLCDLDGDDKAEILVWDGTAIRAWHGDGRGAAPDGSDTLARVPNVRGWGGISAADLNGDSRMDLFIERFWVRLPKRDQKGEAEIIAMADDEAAGNAPQNANNPSPKAAQVLRDALKAAQPASPRRGFSTTTQPSLCDLDGDGQAEVLFGAVDGRVWVFHTRQTLKRQWLQWATFSANYQHTGAWQAPSKPAPRDASRPDPIS